MQKAILTKKQSQLLHKFGDAKSDPNLNSERHFAHVHFRHYGGKPYAMATTGHKLVEFEIEQGPAIGTYPLAEIPKTDCEIEVAETEITGIDWRPVFPEHNREMLGIFWADSILWAAKILAPMCLNGAVRIDFRTNTVYPLSPRHGMKGEIKLVEGRAELDYEMGLNYSVIQDAFKGNPRTFWHGPSRPVIVEHDDHRCLVMPCLLNQKFYQL